jgi:truncated hemoglobin YjbI
MNEKFYNCVQKNDTLWHFFKRKMRAKMNRYGTFFNAS